MASQSQSNSLPNSPQNRNGGWSNSPSSEYGSDKVIVYILSSDPESARTQRVLSLFEHGLFKGHIVSISPPDDLMAHRNLNAKDAMEAYRYNYVLSDAHKKYPNNHVVVIKETSTSHASPEYIADTLAAARNSGDWDLFYLNRWGDNCFSYSKDTSDLVRTTNAQGTQAIAFSPQGRDKILGKAPLNNGQKFPALPNSAGSSGPQNNQQQPLSKPLGTQLQQAAQNKGLNAVTLKNNLIDYDVSSAKSPADYHRLMQCQPVASGSSSGSGVRYDVNPTTGAVTATSTNSTSGSSGLIWFLILIIVIILIAWLLMRNRNRA